MKKEFLTQRRRGAETQRKTNIIRLLSFENLCVFASLRLCVSIVFLAFGIFAQSDGSQQNQTGKAGTFAITGARIVTVSGAVIENGTVIITNG